MAGRWRFGLPLIASSVVSVLKDAVNPIYIGLLLGASSVGYVNLAQQIAVVGIYILFILTKVYFPVFARLRSRPVMLRRAVATSALWSNVFVALIASFTLLNSKAITSSIYGEQWLPAVPTLELLLFANLLAPTATVLLALMNALGRAIVPLTYTVIWSAATWLLAPPLISHLGMVGYGWANIGVTLLALPLFWQGRQYLWGRSLLLAMSPWPLAVSAMAASNALLSKLEGDSELAELLVVGLLGCLLFAVMFFAVASAEVRDAWRVVVK
jgi:O-antigen/teichoic acid export membrane protein